MVLYSSISTALPLRLPGLRTHSRARLFVMEPTPTTSARRPRLRGGKKHIASPYPAWSPIPRITSWSSLVKPAILEPWRRAAKALSARNMRERLRLQTSHHDDDRCPFVPPPLSRRAPLVDALFRLM